MSKPVLTFFSNRGGVGQSLLIYHLAWTLADMGKSVLIADLDPQANLTAAFLDENEIEELWSGSQPGATISRAVKPLAGGGDIARPPLRRIAPGLHLIPGDVELSGFEETLSAEWLHGMGEHNLYRPMRTLSAFWQILQAGAGEIDADVIMIDIGPGLGAINRSALIAADFVVIPLDADLFSLQGLKYFGSTLRSWRSLWAKRVENWHSSNEAKEYPDFHLPRGAMQPIGYLYQQPSFRLDRSVKAYDRWIKRIPVVYREAVLNEQPSSGMLPENDPCCLATIKPYRSLIPMAQEHRKPIFKLTSADGAIGSHAGAVQDARRDFRNLAGKMLAKIEA